MNLFDQRIIPAVPHVATTTTFASVGGNSPLYFIPVTITNNQAGSTAVNLQVKIVTNPNASSSYYAANLSNVNWQDGNGHILNSWLENGSSNLAASAVYWINLSSNVIAGSGGTFKIYEVIYNSSINVMNNQNTGAYPSYSSTYGQYDDGQYIFQKYYNFYGTSLPGTMTMVRENTGFSYTVNNGLSISGTSSYGGDNQAIHIYTTGTGSYNIAEMFLTSATLASPASWELSLGIDNPSFSQSNDAGFTYAYRYDYLNGYYRIIADNSGTSVYSATTSAPLVTPAIETLLWPSRGSESGQSNNTQKVVGTDNTFSFQNTYLDVALVTSSQYTSSSFQISWLRTRLNPPSGVMPSILLGSLTSIAISNTVLANPTSIDQTQNSNLTATVSGGFSPYTYQWMQKAPGSGSFTNISGATSINYTFTTNSSTTTGAWQFALQVNDANGTILITASPTTIQVNTQLGAPAVSLNYGTIDLGQSAVATSTEVITGTSPYVYQWLNSTNIGGPFTIISGATAATFLFTPWAIGTWYFKLNVTDSAGVPVRVTSNAIMVVVNTPLLAPTVSVNNGTIDLGQTATLSTTAITTGTPTYFYQWLNSTTGGADTYAAIPGATGAVYNFTPWMDGTWYFKLNVTDSAGVNVTMTSNAVTVTVNSPLVAPLISVNYGTIDLGQSATFSSTAVTSGTPTYSYQWLNSTTGGSGTYVAIPGATSSNYLFTSWATGTWYLKLNVTDSAGVNVTMTSNAVTVTVNSPLVAPLISVNYGTIDLGQSATFSSTAVTSGTPTYSYQWLNSTTGGAGTYVAIPGATSSNLFFTSWATGTWYLKLNVTDSAGVNLTLTSNVVTILINSQLVAPTPAANYTLIDQGQNIYLTASSGGNGTAPYIYQWYSLAPGAGSYSLIIGATTENYTFLTTTNTPTGVWNFKLNVTDSSGIPSTATTIALMVTINSQLQAPSVTTLNGAINQGQLTYLSNSTNISTGTPFYSPQWYSKVPGSGSYSPIAGGNVWNYTFTTTTSTMIGTWNFVLNVTDSANVAVTITSAMVLVIVDDIPQFIMRANNITYIYGQTGNQLSWTVGDALSNVQGYTIYVNSTLNATGTWITGNAITKNVDYLWVGWYNYSIIVSDGYGGINTTWAYVLVIDDAPQFSQSSNLTYVYGQTGQALSWTINDLAYTTTSWTLYVNNSQNATGMWVPGLPITINVSGLWVGWANYSLMVDDGLGRTNSTWVNVTILNDIPILNHPPQFLGILAGTTGNYIQWIVTDGAYINPTWVLFNNVTGSPHYPTPNATGYWSSGVSINISIDNLPMGTWNWTFIAYDGFGGSCINEIYVNVSNNPAPSLTQPPNVLMMVGDTGYSITWTITDLSNDTETATYWVYQDSVNLVGTGLWAITSFSNTVTIPLTNLAVGIYNFTIIADNGKEMQSQDECDVSVNDYPIVNHPASIIFNAGTKGHVIAWTVTDFLSGICSFTFYIGGSQFAHNSWVPAIQFNISLDSFTSGTYNYIIVINDGFGGQAQDTGTIVVNDLPVINQPANISLPYGSPDNTITWLVSDSISTYRNYTVFLNATPTTIDQPWNPGNPIAVTANDTCNFGIYVYTILVDDGLNGTVTSTIWVTVLDDDPVITTPPNIDYHYGTSGHVIEWTITHQASPSGTYSISVSGIEQSSGSWTSGIVIQIVVDSLGIGSFEYVCFASDGLKNCSDIVLVTVFPDIPQVSTAPKIFTYGTTTNNIAFTITATYLSATHYTIYVNGTQNATGTWIPGLPIVLNIDHLWVGTYNYSIIADNGMGEIGTTWAMVTVLDDLPQIVPSPDIIFYVGSKNNEIWWTASDGAYATTTYIVYINGTTIFATGTWSDGVPIPFNVDSFNVGNYNLSFVVYDGLGGSSVTYMLVIVNPLIPGVANPLTIVVQTRVQRDNASFSFAVFDATTFRPYPRALTNITLSFGLGNTFDADNLTWKIGTTNGEYNLIIDTRSIPAGTYLIQITFSRQNYTDVTQVVTLTVIPFEPIVELPQGILSFSEGTDVVIKVRVRDIPLLNQTFDNIDINWEVTGTSISGAITTVNSSGYYFIKFNTESLLPNANYYLTISIEVSISGVTYTMSSPQEVNIRVEYSTIFGIPQPYFWVIVLGVIIAITIFPLVRFFTYVRLPPTVKRINEINKIIKNKKKITPKEIPSDDTYDYLVGMYRSRWKAFNIPPSKKLKVPRSTKEVEKDT